MDQQKQIATRPAVQLVGDVTHPDFRDAIMLLRDEAQLTARASGSPELIVVAQSRPGSFPSNQVAELQHSSPLVGMVALAGSWCEGETRTGKPWPGIQRLYWYEFPAWWRRQLALRAAGLCPDWARPGDARMRIADPLQRAPSSCGLQIAAEQSRGLIAICAGYRETADALADVLRRTGYATAWQPPGRRVVAIRGAVAGIWEGGQLNDREADDLSSFCRRLANDAAPVIALLDFPRRHSVDRALEIGARAVLGKPWLNVDLIAALQATIDRPNVARAA
jgi:hypothetical protein